MAGTLQALDLSEFGASPALDLNEFQAPAPKPASAFQKMSDLGLSVAKGVIAVPEAAVGIADLVTGGHAGRLAERAGVRFKEAKDILGNLQSEDYQGKQRQFADADGVLAKTGVALTNPSLVANAVAESVPAMLAGGVVGRGAMALAPRLGAAGAAAIGEGAVGAGSAGENIRQQTGDGLLTGGQSALAAGTGVATGAFNRLGGFASNKLGIGDIDQMIVNGSTAAAGQVSKGAIRRAAEGAFSEGVLEELPQGLTEQGLQNLALGRPWAEGMADAGVMSVLAGGSMGAGAAVVGHSPRHPAPLGIDPNAGPISKAASQMMALPAPVVTVGGDGVAMTAEQRMMARAAPQGVTDLQPREVQAQAAAPAATPPAAAAAAPPVLNDTNVDPGTGEIRSAYEVRQADAPQIEPNDVLSATGEPFNSIFAAKKAAREAGDGFAPIKLSKGRFVVRQVSESTPDGAPAAQENISDVQNTPARPASQAEAAPAETPAAPADRGGQPAAAGPKAGTGALEAVGVDSPRAAPAPIAGKPLDKDWRAFSPESGTLSVPRAEMPQIKAEHRGAMVNFLKARGIESRQEEVAADSLKPTQTEFSPEKVAKAKDFTGGDRSILVSSDGHVLDGHHQWMARRDAGEPVKVIRLDMPIRDLLNAVGEFPSATVAQGAAPAARAPRKAAAPAPLEAQSSAQDPAGLSVTFDGKTYPVESVEDAQRKWLQFVGKTGIGARNATGVTVRDGAGTEIARLSYNGRAWKGKDLLAEAPGAQPSATPVKVAPVAKPAPVVEPVTVPQREVDPSAAAIKKPRVSKADRVAAEEAQRAAYFTPGNLVRGYAGFDEVLDYDPPAKAGDGWSVTVHRVQEVDGQWVRMGRPRDARSHSTQPEERLLKNGPVRKLKFVEAGNVPYSDSSTGGPARGVAAPIEAYKSTSPDAFVQTPDGKVDFGEITAAMAKTMKRQAGKIKLQQGDASYGLTHIEARHGEQIAKMGFKDSTAFVADALSHIEAIWSPDKTSQLVVIESSEKGRAVFIQLKPGKDESGDFYTVNTAFPTGKGFAEKKEGWKTLWSRAPAPADNTGKPSSFAEPADKAGQQATMESNQSAGPILPEAPASGKPGPAVAANTVFTEDAAAAARAILKKKLNGTLNSGIDPELLQAGLTLAGYHVERGARTFAAYATAMIADLGESVNPYLQSWYMAVKYDPRAGAFEGMDNAQAMEAVDLATLTTEPAPAPAAPAQVQNQKKETSDVPDTNGRVERDLSGSAPEPAVGNSVPAQARGTARGAEDAGGQTGRSDGRGQPNSDRVSTRGPLTDRERGNQLLLGGNRPSQSSLFDAGTHVGERGSDLGDAGVSIDRRATGDAAQAVDQGRGGLREVAQRRKAAAIPVKRGDLDNIRETLPELLPGQQEDVHLAEKRFAEPTGYGMLFTNGTGTGKTFTGLGIAKRFAMEGKGNSLVLVPDDKIADDWIVAGKRLGLKISRLQGTTDAGEGMVITTYANLGANDALASRQWDLVIPDEAHTLMQAANGELTGYLQNLRAITYHPDGAGTRDLMLHRADYARAREITELTRANVATMFRADTPEARKNVLVAQNQRLNAEAATLTAKLSAGRAAVNADVTARQGASRPRLAALTATPFAYEKTVDWANGYLFDYKDGYPFDENSGAYNQPDPRQYFFQTRFGYTMRYNKLTEPDGSKVDRSLLQRQFNGSLKKAGSLSGRMLDVVPDYDRRFVLVDSAIGNQIDEALSWVAEQSRSAPKGDSGFHQLRKLIDDRFDYLSRRYLLEAIKAHEVVPIVKQHMAMGRKVVVFHDYKKGGGFHPFALNKLSAPAEADDMQREVLSQRNAAISAFNDKFADLINFPFGEYSSPVEIFKRELPDTLLVNGDEKKSSLLARYKKFQDDASGPQVMLVQSAKNKGWSGHDTTGKHQRVLINLGQPTAPTTAIQQEGRIYRTGQASNAIMRYLNTGTNWEKWAFATTIASRASTAENLGMGELSRALKDSFIASFEQSDSYPPGHEGEGVGGKEQDKSANAAISEYDRAKTHYWATGKKTSKTKAQEGKDYFATPEPLGLKMVEWLDARPSENTLEPSAGHGAIARWLPETSNRTAIEPSLALRSRLAMAMDPSKDRIIDGTFEDLSTSNKYDGIVMNPPFGAGGKMAVEHLAKAVEHLRDGGRIVALLPTGPAADKRFDAFMYEPSTKPVKPLFSHPTLGEIWKGDTVHTRAKFAPNGVVSGIRLGSPNPNDGVMVKIPGVAGLSSVNPASFESVEKTGKRTESFRPAAGLHMVADILLPQVTFERAGTAVATRVVVLEKGVGAETASTVKKDFTSVTDINQLFDRLETQSLPGRAVHQVGAPALAAATDAPVETPKAAPPEKVAQAADVGGKVLLDGTTYPVTVYTTAAGKELRGVWVGSKAQALTYGPTTFEKKGQGFFVRERDFPKVEAGSQAESGPTASTFSTPAQEQANAAVQVQADRIAALWSNPPKIVVAFDMDDPKLPADLKAEDLKQRSGGATGTPEGFYFKGTTYLMSSKLVTPRDVARVLFHEGLGHYGLRGAFGKALTPILREIALVRRAEVDAKIKEYGLRGVTDLDRITAAEEVLAEMAEKVPQIGFVRRAVAAIRSWLRANVPGFNNLGVSDDQIIRDYILPARGWVMRRQESAAVTDAPALASAGGMAQTSTPAFKRWFGDSKVVDADGKPLVVYHGTTSDFVAFELGKVGSASDSGMMGTGFYFATNKDNASHYARKEGGNIRPVYLSLRNPFETNNYGKFPKVEAPRALAEMRIADKLYSAKLRELLLADGHDGVIFTRPDGSKELVAFHPEQIKSAIGNNGDFDGNLANIMLSRSKPATLSESVTDAFNNARAVKLPAGYMVGDFFNNAGKLNWWHKSVGTMYNLAQRSPPFKRVYDGVQNFLNDVSFYATEAADLAPNILPKLDTWKDITRTPLSPVDNKAIAAPIFEGTLVWGRDEQGKPVKMETLQAKADKLDAEQKARELLRQGKVTEQMLKMWQGLPLGQYETVVKSRYDDQVLKAGTVFTPTELKTIFGLNDAQVALYQEFRAATDKSLTSLAITDMVRYGGKDVEPVAGAAMQAKTVEEASAMLRDYLLTLSSGSDRKDLLIDMAGKIIEKSDRARDLMNQGYAPLSRFGTHTVDVVDTAGTRVYFGLFESKADSAKMGRRMALEFPGAKITQGTTSDQAYKLFAGVSPETLELFGEMLGLESQGDDASSQAFQEYLKLARSSRSAMKRLIQRKGIAGFSEDPGRVLAGFIYSNARQASSSLHMGQIAESVNEIPQGQGQLKDAAIGLQNYIKNPQEEAQAFRGLLFAQYLGGSVASAMVNMTQPLTVTFPYLSQFGGVAKAAAQMRRAAGDVMKKSTGEVRLDAALKLAEEQGIVAPQEVHQLMAQANGSGSLRSGDGTKMGNATASAGNAMAKVSLVWGKLFSSAEQFNRRLTFIAAYRTALEQGMSNPAGFAEKVIAETQFTYNKGSKPRWARGAIGGTLFTFKQYSVNYLELVSRMATQGGPDGRRAAVLMVAVLFLMGGAGGLPFVEDAEDLIDGMLQRLGYNFNTKQRRGEFLQGMLGREAANFVENGLTGLPGAPIDLSGRMGMGNLIPGTGLLTKKTDYTRDVVEMAGPAGDLVSRAFQSGNELLKGNVGAAALALSPVAARNLTKAVDMATMGMYRDQSGKKVIDTDGYDALAKAVGFQPANVAKVQESSRAVQIMVAQNKIRESEIADEWAKGKFEDNPDKVRAARDSLARWNENNPEAPIRINMMQIAKRVKAMRQTKEERLAKTAPTEIRAAVRRELAQDRS